VKAALLLNLAGGEAVDDLDVLEADEGFSPLRHRMANHGLPRPERRELERRWRNSRERAVPTPSGMFR
jgi:hypothetical protein